MQPTCFRSGSSSNPLDSTVAATSRQAVVASGRSESSRYDACQDARSVGLPVAATRSTSTWMRRWASYRRYPAKTTRPSTPMTAAPPSKLTSRQPHETLRDDGGSVSLLRGRSVGIMPISCEQGLSLRDDHSAGARGRAEAKRNSAPL